MKVHRNSIPTPAKGRGPKVFVCDAGIIYYNIIVGYLTIRLHTLKQVYNVWFLYVGQTIRSGVLV